MTATTTTTATNTTNKYAVYTRRYWMLLVLAIASGQQSCIWMTYSPLETEVKRTYHWTTADITFLAAYGPIGGILLTPFIGGIVDRLGLRGAIVLSATLAMIATTLRSLTTTAPYALILAHVAQFLNALCGPLVLATPALLSERWFPPHHRNTSTALGVAGNWFGTGIGFLTALPVNSTSALRRLLWLETLFAAVFWLIMMMDWWLFDPRPPKPPSASAEVSHSIDIWRDVGILIRNPSFMLLSISSGLATGIYAGWNGVLDEILSPTGIDQAAAGWIGCASIVGVLVGMATVGVVADRLRNIKWLLVGLYLSAFIVFCYWTRAVQLEKQKVSNFTVYGGMVLGSLLLNAVGPITYEAAVECTFPIDVVSMTAVLTLSFNIACGAFQIVAGYVSPTLMTWLMTFTIGAMGVMMIAFREQHRRTLIDEKVGDSVRGVVDVDADTPLLSKI